MYQVICSICVQSIKRKKQRTFRVNSRSVCGYWAAHLAFGSVCDNTASHDGHKQLGDPLRGPRKEQEPVVPRVRLYFGFIFLSVFYSTDEYELYENSIIHMEKIDEYNSSWSKVVSVRASRACCRSLPMRLLARVDGSDCCC